MPVTALAITTRPITRLSSAEFSIIRVCRNQCLEYVVYHEMLHLKHPVKLRGSRRCVHSAEFQAEENLFPEAAEAKRFLLHF